MTRCRIVCIAILILILTISHTNNIVTCKGQIQANNTIVMYNDYDGNIYIADTNGIKTGTTVRCYIDTMGSINIQDDCILYIIPKL